MTNVIELPNSKFAGMANIKPGATLYEVMVIPNYKSELIQTSITKKVITSFPYEVEGVKSLFVDFEYASSFDGKLVKSNFSLGDSNIPENGYNVHRLFTSKENAEKYMKHIQDPSQWTEKEAEILKRWMLEQANKGMFPIY